MASGKITQVLGPVVDVEFDDGIWEIDAYRGKEKRELHVDPRTGKILRDRED